MVLDIGAETGALVVHTTEDLCDAEIEIRSAGTPWAGTHTVVRPRDHGGAVRFAAVFPALLAGTYEIRVRHRAGARPSPLWWRLAALPRSCWRSRDRSGQDPNPVGGVDSGAVAVVMGPLIVVT